MTPNKPESEAATHRCGPACEKLARSMIVACRNRMREVDPDTASALGCLSEWIKEAYLEFLYD